jgi:DNA repair protein RadD
MGFILRPYQTEMVQQARIGLRDHTGVLMQAATGAGKTAIGAHLVGNCVKKGKTSLFIVHRQELIEQTIGAFTMEGIPHGVIAAGHYMDLQQPVQICSIDTLKRRLNKIRYPDLVVFDECFVAGTLIDGRAIENLATGDYVNSFNHKTNVIESRKILGVMQREYDGDWYKITTTCGKDVVCTENHPFFIVGEGYVPAKLLRQYDGHAIITLDDKTMPKLQKRTQRAATEPQSILQQRLFRYPYKNNKAQSTIGRSELLRLQGASRLYKPKILSCRKAQRKGVLQRNLFMAIPQTSIFTNYERNEYPRQRNYLAQDEEKQSFIPAGNPKNHNRQVTRSHVSFSRGKRANYKTASSNPRINQSAYGIYNKYIPSQSPLCFLAYTLQGGFSRARGEIIHRDRWQKPFIKKMEIPQQKKDGNFEFSRLAGVEICQRGSRSKPEWLPKKNTVYNIHVAKNNNYFANGILVHNCHHIAAAGWSRVFEYFSKAKHIGLSATPQRLDGKGLGKWYGKMVNGPPIQWLIDQGYLVNYRAYAPSAPDMSEVHSKMGEFVQSEVEDAMNRSVITGDIIKHYLSHARGKRFIQFSPSRKYSENTAETFRAGGVMAIHVDGETDRLDRKRAMQGFRDGNINGLTNVGLFGEGVDVPAAEVLIDCQPTKSLTRVMQAWGRVLRPVYAPGFDLNTQEGRLAAIAASSKPDAIILDHAGNIMRHGLPCDSRQWSLADKKKKAKKDDEEADIAVKQCPECFHLHKPLPKCPRCGYVYEVNHWVVEEVAGTLHEINKEQMKAARGGQLKKAKTLEELVTLGISWGYQYPVEWAERILAERAEWKANINKNGYSSYQRKKSWQ